MVTYLKDDIEKVIVSLKDTLCGLTEPGAEVYTTGVGCNKYAKLISETLGVKINNIMEGECNAAALRFMMENLAFTDCVHAPSKSAKPKIYEEVSIFEALKPMAAAAGGFGGYFDDYGTPEDAFPTFPEHDTKVSENKGETVTDKGEDVHKTDQPPGIILPALLYYIGSGQFFATLKADYSFKYIGVNTAGGRTLMGLASLLVGAQSFKELVSLAEAGDASKVDTKCKHLRDPDVKDMYSILPEDKSVYCFGEAVNKNLGDFKREDLAAALISLMMMNIAQLCHRIFLTSDARTIIFLGGVCSESQYIRDEIAKHFGIFLYTHPKAQKADYYFLKHGTYTGALGALLYKPVAQS